jgi:16S rRNA (uracil1498-N3)-methyltransferase
MTVPRLHLAEPLAAGREIDVAADRAHYLRTVLRLRTGEPVHLFNADDGEWRARLSNLGRHEATLVVEAQLRAATPEPGPSLAFAPIRRHRLDWLVEKAVELGAARLVPVITRRTVAKPESSARLAAIATEAAEQCGRLTLPAIEPPQPLSAWLEARDAGVPLIFADERGGGLPLVDALPDRGDVELLVGPEGGFAPEERQILTEAAALAVTLGPRTLRAETAACYLLAGWQIARAG